MSSRTFWIIYVYICVWTRCVKRRYVMFCNTSHACVFILFGCRLSPPWWLRGFVDDHSLRANRGVFTPRTPFGTIRINDFSLISRYMCTHWIILTVLQVRLHSRDLIVRWLYYLYNMWQCAVERCLEEDSVLMSLTVLTRNTLVVIERFRFRYIIIFSNRYCRDYCHQNHIT